MNILTRFNNNKAKILSLGTLVCINNLDKEEWKEKSFYSGYNLSQKFKNYKSWDSFVEPFLIRQFAFFFGVTNSFIKGLISDNKDQKALDEEIKEEICSTGKNINKKI